MILYSLSNQFFPPGNPRNKVALLPGYSLMDWIRLGNSGKDLTSVGGTLQDVTEEELAQHNQEGNAWLVIRGNFFFLYMGKICL